MPKVRKVIELCTEKQFYKVLKDGFIYVVKRPCKECTDEERSLKLRIKRLEINKTFGTCKCEFVGKLAKIGGTVYILSEDRTKKGTIEQYLEDTGFDNLKEFIQTTKTLGAFPILCKAEVIEFYEDAVEELKEVLENEGRGDEGGS